MIENGMDPRDKAVLDALNQKIVEPWWGTHSQLLKILDIQVPPYMPQLSPQGLSKIIAMLEEAQVVYDWTIHRWHSGKARMIALMPPGWVWDDANRRWTMGGVPVDPAPPR
jgi:hypothetical protein